MKTKAIRRTAAAGNEETQGKMDDRVSIKSVNGLFQIVASNGVYILRYDTIERNSNSAYRNQLLMHMYNVSKSFRPLVFLDLYEVSVKRYI